LTLKLQIISSWSSSLSFLPSSFSLPQGSSFVEDQTTKLHSIRRTILSRAMGKIPQRLFHTQQKRGGASSKQAQGFTSERLDDKRRGRREAREPSIVGAEIGPNVRASSTDAIREHTVINFACFWTWHYVLFCRTCQFCRRLSEYKAP
jgi:hypothetical protein